MAEFLEAIRPGFSNPKHFAQWKMTLTTYAASLKDKRLDQITAVDVVATLRPIWTRISSVAGVLPRVSRRMRTVP